MMKQSTRLGTCFRLVTLVSAGALGVLMLAAIGPQQASAHCAGGALEIREPGNDKFWNFDFGSQTVGACNVDWPVNFVFVNDATVDRVKHRMASVGYDDEGSGFWGRLNNGNPSDWKWNFDKGRKNFSRTDCWFGDMEHFRVYAADDNRMFNMNWGFYVLATSHIDHHECGLGSWSGMSETAEDRIASDARDAPGLGVVDRNDIRMNNHLNFEVASDGHRKENGGRATRIRVP